MPAWDGQRHYSGPRRRTLAYVLVLDTLNFSFWGGPAGGYWRLAEALRDAFRAGGELADERRLAEIGPDRLRRLLGELPLLDERAAALRELGGHGFAGLLQPTAAATAATLAQRLPSFADVAIYEDHRVPLLKRAQIAAADLHGAGVAGFPDLADLTCFADYKLPQVLRHFGVFEYSQELARRVDGWEELTAGEPAEVEIRACTVSAVEGLRLALAGRGRRLADVELDWILWELGQGLFGVRPHHRTRTIYY